MEGVTGNQEEGTNKAQNNLIDLIEDKDVIEIMECQRRMLTRFDKTNEMLVHCNHLAAARIERASRDLKQHCFQLEELKKDVDSVFKRIRSLKNKLSHEYPEAFKACTTTQSFVEDEEEDADVERATEGQNQVTRS